MVVIAQNWSSNPVGEYNRLAIWFYIFFFVIKNELNYHSIEFFSWVLGLTLQQELL